MLLFAVWVRRHEPAASRTVAAPLGEAGARPHLSSMRPILILTALIAASAAPALAQVPPPYAPPYASYPGGVPAAIANQHR